MEEVKVTDGGRVWKPVRVMWRINKAERKRVGKRQKTFNE